MVALTFGSLPILPGRPVDALGQRREGVSIITGVYKQFSRPIYLLLSSILVLSSPVVSTYLLLQPTHLRCYSPLLLVQARAFEGCRSTLQKSLMLYYKESPGVVVRRWFWIYYATESPDSGSHN